MTAVKMFSLVYISILIGYNAANVAATPWCRDERNQPVDWYVLNKLPKMTKSSIPNIRDGLAYLYITNNTVDKGWQLSSKQISAKDSIPGNTLALLYNDSTAANIFWALYNDKPPNKPINGKYGHAKGIVVVNQLLGFWLIHSVPNYPPTPNCGEELVNPTTAPGNKSEYDYPSSGKNYGQSFLCISVKSDQFDPIGRQLIYNEATMFKRNIPDEYDRLFPTLTDAAREKKIKQPPFTSKVVLRSSGYVQFWSFAKSDKWQKELYDDFVAPTLNSDLLAETWLNGRGRLPSDCVGAKVYNVLSINLKKFNIDFNSSHDHSKWAVAVESKINQTWVCIGDINRADTQYIRGGGTVCFNVRKVWESYRDAVNDVEPCPKIYNTVLIQ